MPTTHTAYVALGANIDSPVQQLQTAVTLLAQRDDVQIHRSSPIYRSAAYGNTDQDDFYNAVIEIKTSLSAFALLNTLLLQEQAQGRIRKTHWGPRCIDLDLLTFNDEQWCSNTLTLPHPEIAKRQFVLQPLADIAPHFQLYGQTIDQLIANCEHQAIQPTGYSLISA